jgi:hypothetical protein
MHGGVHRFLDPFSGTTQIARKRLRKLKMRLWGFSNRGFSDRKPHFSILEVFDFKGGRDYPFKGKNNLLGGKLFGQYIRVG